MLVGGALIAVSPKWYISFENPIKLCNFAWQRHANFMSLLFLSVALQTHFHNAILNGI
jgi:hypothetical protein